MKELVAETRGAALSNFLNPAVFREIVLQAFSGPLHTESVLLVEELCGYVQACA